MKNEISIKIDTFALMLKLVRETSSLGETYLRYLAQDCKELLYRDGITNKSGWINEKLTITQEKS